jgi:ABC-type bacteriocin/lantibiotic exporter with double-glycine peptidase domain
MTPIASLNVPHFRQEQAASCTAACVRMVLAYYGQSHSEDELRQLLRTGARGTPARNVAYVSSLGLEVEVKFSNVAELGAALLMGTPPIVYVDSGPLEYWSVDCSHVAVLVGMELGAVLLNDPGFDSAPQKATLDNFLQAWAANGFLAAFIRPREKE